MKNFEQTREARQPPFEKKSDAKGRESGNIQREYIFLRLCDFSMIMV